MHQPFEIMTEFVHVQYSCDYSMYSNHVSVVVCEFCELVFLGLLLTITHSFSFSVNLYKVTGQFPWSSLRETDRGVSTEFSVKDLFYYNSF